MNDKVCPICSNINLESFRDKKRQYFRCKKIFEVQEPMNLLDTAGCGCVFVDPICLLQKKAQKERYLLHNNTLEDNGYRSFIEKFANTVLSVTDEYNLQLCNILDYGCGPSPALLQVLEEKRKTGKLSPAVEIRGWDPYFAPDVSFFEQGADLVTCLEVAEHFEKPLEDFLGLSASCRVGGLIAIQTMLTKETNEAFKAWWYKEDTTHVVFYSLESLVLCAKKVGLLFLKEEKGVFFFKKIT